MTVSPTALGHAGLQALPSGRTVQVRESYGEQELYGMLSSDPVECLSFDPAARWITAEYQAGDVLAFPMDLLHGSCTNWCGPRISFRDSSCCCHG